MNELTTRASNLPALKMDEAELLNVLRNSLYPDATDASIKLVIGYCQASGLDPMQKPVHLVPMWSNKTKGMRDVVMPGIGLYRVQASRSGEYAGMTEPEYGEDVTETLGGQQITYPRWCRVTVRRILANGQTAEFTAKEFWKENYATKGKDSPAPNAMWSRRPYAQIAKCAEAQALRKAFPEIGSAPTADEMEGKEFEAREIDVTPRAEYVPPEKPQMSNATFARSLDKARNLIAQGKKTADEIVATTRAKYSLTPEQISAFMDLAAEAEEAAERAAISAENQDFVNA